MPVINFPMNGPVPPNGPPYLESREPLDVLVQLLNTRLPDGRLVRDVAIEALAGNEDAEARMGFLGLRCEHGAIVLASPAFFSRALPVVYENGGLYAFHAVGGITPDGKAMN
jgi:hypothetical protein